MNDPVSDDLWDAIYPLLPPERPRDHGGPPRVPHRAALGGILFILRHGLRWRDLPRELGYGSGVTCWRRLREWQALGIWAMLHQVVLNWLGDLDAIDWTRASVDSISIRAKRGGEHTGPNPTDRGKAGSKYHFLVERTQAWVVAFRKLAVRYDRHAATVLAFLHLASALICLRFLLHAETEPH